MHGQQNVKITFQGH